jgi:hypothetical protein
MKNDPKTIARLLRAMATATAYKQMKHDVILKAAADLLDPPALRQSEPNTGAAFMSMGRKQ